MLTRKDLEREVTFDEFLALIRKDIDGFEKMWRENNQKDPELWPMKDWVGDWYEHFDNSLGDE